MSSKRKSPPTKLEGGCQSTQTSDDVLLARYKSTKNSSNISDLLYSENEIDNLSGELPTSTLSIHSDEQENSENIVKNIDNDFDHSSNNSDQPETIDNTNNLNATKFGNGKTVNSDCVRKSSINDNNIEVDENDANDDEYCVNTENQNSVNNNNTITNNNNNNNNINNEKIDKQRKSSEKPSQPLIDEHINNSEYEEPCKRQRIDLSPVYSVRTLLLSFNKLIE